MRHWMILAAIVLLFAGYLHADMNANTSMSGNIPPPGEFSSGSMSTVDNDIALANDVPIPANTQPTHNLLGDVQSALSLAVPQSQIIASVDRRIVILKGTARTYEEVTRAKRAVLDVPGVVGVRSQVRIVGTVTHITH